MENIAKLNMIDINHHKSFQVACLQRKQRRAEQMIARNKELAIIRKKIFQKLIGILVIVGTILVCSSPLLYVEETGGQDWTIALIMIPIGLYCLFSRKCWLFR